MASSAGVATGPVGFLRTYDSAFGEVAQGGTRRGANMAVLRVDHPDIEAFVTCKAKEGEIANFNISVGITDAFMQAVEADGDFPLINPRDGKVWRTVRARDLFDKIVTFAHHNGEPGALFLDAANRSNPVPHLYELEATNPCGEQCLGPYENCCLGSINLAQHMTDDGRVDWEKLRDQHGGLHPLPGQRGGCQQIRAGRAATARGGPARAAHRPGHHGAGRHDVSPGRPLRLGRGAGVRGAGHGVRALPLHGTSIALAQERGPFLAIKGSIYDPEDLRWQPPAPLAPYAHDWGRPALDWDEIVAGIKQHGIRNAAQTTVAPTGTIGTVAGCEGYGCEPVFALAYTRTVKDGDRDLKLTYTSPLFERALIAGRPGQGRARPDQRDGQPDRQLPGSAGGAGRDPPRLRRFPGYHCRRTRAHAGGDPGVR